MGVSVCECLQNVCVRAQLWVSECGLLHHLRWPGTHVCFVHAAGFVSRLCTDLYCEQVTLYKNDNTGICVCARVRVRLQEAMGCTSLSVTVLLVLLSNWHRQRTCHAAVTAG